MQLVLVVHWFSWLTGLLVQMDHRWCRWFARWWFTGSVGSLVMIVCWCRWITGAAGPGGSLVQLAQWFAGADGSLVQMVQVVH